MLTHNLQLHPDSAEAHAALGLIRLSDGDLDAARSSLERALELNPDDAMARMGLERIRAAETPEEPEE